MAEEEEKKVSNQTAPDAKEDTTYYNFGSNLIDMKIRGQKAMDEHFMRFCNDFSILSNYHHDYTTEEMIGIHKFLEPMIVFDEEVREYNDRLNIKVGRHFRSVREHLKEELRQEQISMFKNIKEGQMDHWLGMLEEQSKKYLEEKGK